MDGGMKPGTRCFGCGALLLGFVLCFWVIPVVVVVTDVQGVWSMEQRAVAQDGVRQMQEVETAVVAASLLARLMASAAASRAITAERGSDAMWRAVAAAGAAHVSSAVVLFSDGGVAGIDWASSAPAPESPFRILAIDAARALVSYGVDAAGQRVLTDVRVIAPSFAATSAPAFVAGRPLSAGSVTVTDPYVPPGRAYAVVSAVAPVYNATNSSQLLGVAAVDVPLRLLSSTVAGVSEQVLRHGHAFLFSASGDVLAVSSPWTQAVGVCDVTREDMGGQPCALPRVACRGATATSVVAYKEAIR
jgi:hypothetical protein